MHALHQTLLPSSAVHHSLFLPNFTPSTIYPLPARQQQDEGDLGTETKVVGNLIVAGGQDLRVFEIRQVTLPVVTTVSPLAADGADSGDGMLVKQEEVQRGLDQEMSDQIGDTFFDNGPSDVRDLFLSRTARRGVGQEQRLCTCIPCPIPPRKRRSRVYNPEADHWLE